MAGRGGTRKARNVDAQLVQEILASREPVPGIATDVTRRAARRARGHPHRVAGSRSASPTRRSIIGAPRIRPYATPTLHAYVSALPPSPSERRPWPTSEQGRGPPAGLLGAHGSPSLGADGGPWAQIEYRADGSVLSPRSAGVRLPPLASELSAAAPGEPSQPPSAVAEGAPASARLGSAGGAFAPSSEPGRPAGDAEADAALGDDDDERARRGGAEGARGGAHGGQYDDERGSLGSDSQVEQHAAPEQLEFFTEMTAHGRRLREPIALPPFWVRYGDVHTHLALALGAHAELVERLKAFLVMSAHVRASLPSDGGLSANRHGTARAAALRRVLAPGSGRATIGSMLQSAADAERQAKLAARPPWSSTSLSLPVVAHADTRSAREAQLAKLLRALRCSLAYACEAVSSDAFPRQRRDEVVVRLLLQLAWLPLPLALDPLLLRWYTEPHRSCWLSTRPTIGAGASAGVQPPALEPARVHKPAELMRFRLAEWTIKAAQDSRGGVEASDRAFRVHEVLARKAQRASDAARARQSMAPASPGGPLRRAASAGRSFSGVGGGQPIGAAAAAAASGSRTAIVHADSRQRVIEVRLYQEAELLLYGGRGRYARAYANLQQWRALHEVPHQKDVKLMHGEKRAGVTIQRAFRYHLRIRMHGAAVTFQRAWRRHLLKKEKKREALLAELQAIRRRLLRSALSTEQIFQRLRANYSARKIWNWTQSERYHAARARRRKALRTIQQYVKRALVRGVIQRELKRIELRRMQVQGFAEKDAAEAIERAYVRFLAAQQAKAALYEQLCSRAALLAAVADDELMIDSRRADGGGGAGGGAAAERAPPAPSSTPSSDIKLASGPGAAARMLAEPSVVDADGVNVVIAVAASVAARLSAGVADGSGSLLGALEEVLRVQGRAASAQAEAQLGRVPQTFAAFVAAERAEAALDVSAVSSAAAAAAPELAASAGAALAEAGSAGAEAAAAAAANLAPALASAGEQESEAASMIQRFARGRHVRALMSASSPWQLGTSLTAEGALEAAAGAAAGAVHARAAAAAREAAAAAIEDATRRGLAPRRAGAVASAVAEARAAAAALLAAHREQLNARARAHALRASSAQLRSLEAAFPTVTLFGGVGGHFAAEAEMIGRTHERAAAARVAAAERRAHDAAVAQQAADLLARAPPSLAPAEWRARAKRAHARADEADEAARGAAEALCAWRASRLITALAQSVRARLVASSSALLEVARVDVLKPSFQAADKPKVVAARARAELAQAALGFAEAIEQFGGLKPEAGELELEIAVPNPPDAGGAAPAAASLDFGARPLSEMLLEELRGWYNVPEPFSLRVLSSAPHSPAASHVGGAQSASLHRVRLKIPIALNKRNKLDDEYVAEWDARVGALAASLGADVGEFGGQPKAARLQSVGMQLELPAGAYVDLRVLALEPPALVVGEEPSLDEREADAAARVKAAEMASARLGADGSARGRMPTRTHHWLRGALTFLRHQRSLATSGGVALGALDDDAFKAALAAGGSSDAAVANGARRLSQPSAAFLSNRVRWSLIRSKASGAPTERELRRAKADRRQVYLSLVQARAQRLVIERLRFGTLAVLRTRGGTVPGTDGVPIDVWWNLFPGRAPPRPGEPHYAPELGKGAQLDLWSALQGVKANEPWVHSSRRKRAGQREWEAAVMTELKAELERTHADASAAVEASSAALQQTKAARRRAYEVGAGTHMLNLELQLEEVTRRPPKPAGKPADLGYRTAHHLRARLQRLAWQRLVVGHVARSVDRGAVCTPGWGQLKGVVVMEPPHVFTSAQRLATPQRMRMMAAMLGLRLHPGSADVHALWVAAELSRALLPPHWREVDWVSHGALVPPGSAAALPILGPGRFDSDLRWVHEVSGEMLDYHPLAPVYRQVVRVFLFGGSRVRRSSGELEPWWQFATEPGARSAVLWHNFVTGQTVHGGLPPAASLRHQEWWAPPSAIEDSAVPLLASAHAATWEALLSVELDGTPAAPAAAPAASAPAAPEPAAPERHVGWQAAGGAAAEGAGDDGAAADVNGGGGAPTAGAAPDAAGAPAPHEPPSARSATPSEPAGSEGGGGAEGGGLMRALLEAQQRVSDSDFELSRRSSPGPEEGGEAEGGSRGATPDAQPPAAYEYALGLAPMPPPPADIDARRAAVCAHLEMHSEPVRARAVRTHPRSLLEVREAAFTLGIDPRTQAHLLWLAEEAISAELPLSWSRFDGRSAREPPFFHCAATSLAQWEHPALTRARGVLAALTGALPVSASQAQAARDDRVKRLGNPRSLVQSEKTRLREN